MVLFLYIGRSVLKSLYSVFSNVGVMADGSDDNKLKKTKKVIILVASEENLTIF